MNKQLPIPVGVSVHGYGKPDLCSAGVASVAESGQRTINRGYGNAVENIDSRASVAAESAVTDFLYRRGKSNSPRRGVRSKIPLDSFYTFLELNGLYAKDAIKQTADNHFNTLGRDKRTVVYRKQSHRINQQRLAVCGTKRAVLRRKIFGLRGSVDFGQHIAVRKSIQGDLHSRDRQIYADKRRTHRERIAFYCSDCRFGKVYFFQHPASAKRAFAYRR